MGRFNVLNHALVPEHKVLKEKEKEELLAKYKITPDQLPKIRLSDPCIIAISEKEGPIKPGQIIKIIRNSETAGESVAYRLVIEG